ncbi:MAG: DUF4410 domain-containing protein [Acidobacteria bacterium]|nr:DUF4410 domain-containing protein [Acidobacteriota bacterium]
MKYAIYIFIAFAFALPASALGQGTPGPYQIVEIERFEIAEGVEFPETDLTELMSFMVVHFNKSRRFEQVFLATDTASQTAPARRAKVVGTVTKYSKGSRAARYLIGFGAGRTKLVADIKVLDAETGTVLFEQKVDGHVYGGLFGGETDGAKSNLASEIIKTMTKKGFANKNRLPEK